MVFLYGKTKILVILFGLPKFLPQRDGKRHKIRTDSSVDDTAWERQFCEFALTNPTRKQRCAAVIMRKYFLIIASLLCHKHRARLTKPHAVSAPARGENKIGGLKFHSEAGA